MPGGLMREMTGIGKSRRVNADFPALEGVTMPAPAMVSDLPLLFIPVGDNDARPFGMEARERACRLATNAGLECADEPADGRAALIAGMAYAWDPAWLRELATRPRSVLTLGGKAVMVHVGAGDDAQAAIAALAS